MSATTVPSISDAVSFMHCTLTTGCCHSQPVNVPVRKRKEHSVMNWVEHRAKRESTLNANAASVWEKVRAALQDACESYNVFYCSAPKQQEVQCRLENPNRLLISRTEFGIPNFKTQIVVLYDPAEPAINSSRDNPGHADTFSISADEDHAFAEIDGAPVEADE